MAPIGEFHENFCQMSEDPGVPQILQLNRKTNDESNPVKWIDLDLRDSDTTDWIENKSGLSAEVAQRLLDRDEMNRREVYDDGMLICFHMRKIEPGADQDDQQSNRIWIERDRFITVRSEANPAVDALRAAAQDKTSHWEPYQILAFLLRASVKQLEPLINEIFSKTTKLEDQILEADDDDDIDDELNVIRRQTMRTRRHSRHVAQSARIRNCR